MAAEYLVHVNGKKVGQWGMAQAMRAARAHGIMTETVKVWIIGVDGKRVLVQEWYAGQKYDR